MIQKASLVIKRTIDVLGASMGLLLLSPLMLTVAAAVRVELGAPVFFRQLRPGLHGKPFMIVKFRTMRSAVDSGGTLLPDSKRITRLGKFLRSSSLDELPELWNVLKGDMSLVGPRPLLLEYLGRYTERQHRRHEMRPGITGMAQVKGRQGIAFSRRLELDVWYVENWSLGLDLRILAATVPSVLRGQGVIIGQEVADVDDVGLNTSAREWENSSQ